jgi:hypothetical protein
MGQASSDVVEQDNPLSLGLEVVAEGKDPAVEYVIPFPLGE